MAANKKNNRSTQWAPPVNYVLGSDREVVRATDGRDYVVLSSRINSKDHKTVPLDPAKDCTIKRSARVDPCTHQPRILLHIDRTDHKQSSKSSDNINENSNEKHTVSKKMSKKNCVNKLTEWCTSPPELAPEPSRCRQPSLVERLKRRSKSSCNVHRKLHTVPFNFQSQNNQCDKSLSEANINDIVAKIKADNEKFDEMISKRNELKESGRGRVTGVEQKEEPTTSGQLELQVPTGTHRIRVHVGLYDPTPQKTAAPTQRTPKGSSNIYNASSERNDSWLSIKNIQKKFSGCRKETTPIINSDAKISDIKQPTSTKSKQNVAESKMISEQSPCSQKQPIPVHPCQPKQKAEQLPHNTKPTSSKMNCSSTFEIATNTIISI